MLTYSAPVIIVDNFLGRANAEQLCQYSVTHESGFLPSQVVAASGTIVDESRRISKVNRDIGPVMPLIEPAIRKAVDEAIPKLGLVNVDSYLLEPELTWCGDGAFFKMHSDTLHRERAHQRVMTVVYYFYNEPKPFSGGQLCIYGLGADANSRPQQEIDPRFDRAVLFPSWFPHEVLPIHCISPAFADGRFAISCWVRKCSSRG
jgi:SM-20-related protein